MLRVGLTGGVGSGKSAVAAVWRAEGVPVIEADALGRALMQPGQPVYMAIAEAFGPAVVRGDGSLDRAALARIAFGEGRLPELNRLVHPPVVAAQEAEFARLAGEEIPLAVVESALIFEASGSGALKTDPGDTAPNAVLSSSNVLLGESEGPASLPGWRDRFDRLVLVSAPEALRLERFVKRMAPPNATVQELDRLREDGRRRLAAQFPEEWKRMRCDFVIENTRSLVLLRREALRVLRDLLKEATSGSTPSSA